jgi:hypothetical protein
MSKRSIAFLLIAGLPTLVFVGSLLFYPQRDLLILWPREAPALGAVIPLVVGVVGYCALALWILADGTRARWRAIGLIGLATVGALAVQIVVTRAGEPDVWVALLRRTYAWKATGYWTVGAPVTDVADFIGNYPARAESYPVHQSRHPPGLSLVFTLGTRLFEAAPGLADAIAAPLREQSCQSLLSPSVPGPVMAAGLFGAIVEIVLAMLAVVPLYFLVKRLAGPGAAAWAVALYPLAPGFGMWVSQFDRGFALITATVLLLCEGIVTANSRRDALAAGVVLSVASFLSFGSLPIAGIAAVYSLVRVWQTTPALAASLKVRPRGAAVRAALALLRPRLIQGALALAGMSTVWIAAFVFFRLDVFALWRAIFGSHLDIPFPYWPFVAWHPWDIITFAGVPLVAIAFTAGWKRAAPLTAAFAVTLGVLSLAHIARGETGRVWLFFMPLAVGAAAIVLASRPRAEQVTVVVLLAVQLVAQASVMRVLNEIGIFPEALPPASVPAGASVIDTRFGARGQIALLAYEMSPAAPNATATVTLYWQRMSAEPIDTSYRAFIHIARDESDQSRVGSQDGMPVRDLFPTTCWQKDVVVKDRREVPIAKDAPPGRYPVFVGLYDMTAGARPPTFASPPARELYGSILLPEPAVVR